MLNKNKDVLDLTTKVLKIFYFLLILISIYLLLKIIIVLKVGHFLLTLLKIFAPLFVGIFIAWLFDPIVKYLAIKGLKRIYGALISYLGLLLFFILLFQAIIPVFLEQINDFVLNIPLVFDKIQLWIMTLFSNINNFEIAQLQNNAFNSLEVFSKNLAVALPNLIISLLSSFVSGIGIFIVGLIIGFYLLINFNNFSDMLIIYLPSKIKNKIRELINEISTTLRKFIKGILLSTTIIFIVSTIGFYIVGLKGALLFGFFCGITNVIPFIGPYIGGLPAVVVAFSQSPHIGLLVLLIIVIVQLIEGNLIHPFLMSKVMNLHPVTIILGLLFFGYYFKIIGMIVATPIIATIKTIYGYFKEEEVWKKHKFILFQEKQDMGKIR